SKNSSKPPSDPAGGGSRPRNLRSTKMAKVAEFQPDMVKIGFSSRMLQIYRSKRTAPERRLTRSFKPLKFRH
ncbi:hypothetical protein, partial [Mesorhizobium sp. M2A.F.Ca.ET.029.05.1.1]|uniref:hypothetical protein n=1 Tax=Mesorhizobium sp. M2A.F.Ca.ET.029.05.1.1 TaxID=2496658 RepID=UPI001AECC537